jgi:hypothetical protein
MLSRPPGSEMQFTSFRVVSLSRLGPATWEEVTRSCWVWPGFAARFIGYLEDASLGECCEPDLPDLLAFLHEASESTAGERCECAHKFVSGNEVHDCRGQCWRSRCGVSGSLLHTPCSTRTRETDAVLCRAGSIPEPPPRRRCDLPRTTT